MARPYADFKDNDPALSPAERKDWIAVLPLGAYEQHGPHLPFETDTLIAAGIVERLKDDLPGDLPVTFLAVQPVGYSVEHMDIEGTATLSFEEAVHRWLDVARELNRQGIRKLVLLNAHGGNSPLMTIVATEARMRLNMLVVATSWTRFGVPEGIISPEEKAIDIHGGDIETSVMLALHPDLVDMDRAANFPSRQTQYIERFKHLRAYGPHAFGWKMSDLSDQGVAGNAAAATAQKGEALIAHAVKGLTELLEDVNAFDLGSLT